MFEKAKRSVKEMILLLTSRAGILLLFAALGLIVGLSTDNVWGWWTFWICTFSAFDVYVFPTTSMDSAYRLGQFMLWLALSLALYEAGAIKALLASVAFWYFLGCDALYLWSKQEKIGPFAIWDMNVFVAYFKYIRKQDGAPAWAVKMSMVIGLIAAVVILI